MCGPIRENIVQDQNERLNMGRLHRNAMFICSRSSLRSSVEHRSLADGKCVWFRSFGRPEVRGQGGGKVDARPLER